MSHFATMNTPITNKQLLVDSLKAKGLEVLYNKQIRGYQGTLSDRMYDIVGCTKGLDMPHDLGFYWGPGLNGVPALVLEHHSDAETYAVYCGVIGDYRMRMSQEQSTANGQRGLLNAKLNVLVGARS